TVSNQRNLKDSQKTVDFQELCIRYVFKYKNTSDIIKGKVWRKAENRTTDPGKIPFVWNSS
ncbi:MAG: hypothetical protein OIF58_13715, partial [Cohaesibacter sp.]|nr:hypothetical protein [Cohaesibacter sp.]